jgi:hypothetical protein
MFAHVPRHRGPQANLVLLLKSRQKLKVAFAERHEDSFSKFPSRVGFCKEGGRTSAECPGDSWYTYTVFVGVPRAGDHAARSRRWIAGPGPQVYDTVERMP